MVSALRGERLGLGASDEVGKRQLPDNGFEFVEQRRLGSDGIGLRTPAHAKFGVLGELPEVASSAVGDGLAAAVSCEQIGALAEISRSSDVERCGFVDPFRRQRCR